MKKVLLSTAVLFCTSLCFAQDIATDNKGEHIFSLPTPGKAQPEFALKNIGVNFAIKNLGRTRYYVTDSNGGKYYTMVKSTYINFQASAVSNSENILIFDGSNSIAPKFEIGINRGIDSFINPSRRSSYFTFSIIATGEYQDLKVYDTTLHRSNNTTRLSPGLKGILNLFFRTSAALSMSVAYKKSIVTDDLTSYQLRTSTFFLDNNIASNGKKEGYLAPADPKGNWRISVSAPIFAISNNKANLPVILVPYYFATITPDSKPGNNGGLILSVLSKSFYHFDKAGDSYRDNASYEFKNAFSIGYNFYNSNSKQGYIFASGTFTLGDLKPKPLKEEKMKKALF